jgi:hypothetical protein
MTLEKTVWRIDQAAKEKLTQLDLAGLDLEELPPKIRNCTQFETLVVGKFDEEKGGWVGNKLSEFPDAVLQLTNLKILNLSWNKITSIPKSLGQLSNLAKLYSFSRQLQRGPQTPPLSSILATIGLRPPIICCRSSFDSSTKSTGKFFTVMRWLSRIA